jgi:mRNA interferase RelE/StbE
VRYEVRLSDRAAKDMDRLNPEVRRRVLNRLEQISEAPYAPRASIALSNRGGLRKSRVGGWRIILSVNDEQRVVTVVTVDRRGQVYHRI